MQLTPPQAPPFQLQSLPADFTRTITSMNPLPSSNSTTIELMGIEWHIGIRAGVFLTERVAATRAVERTLPLTTVPYRIASIVSGFKKIFPTAAASRITSFFELISTICARSFWIWVNSTIHTPFLNNSAGIRSTRSEASIPPPRSAATISPTLPLT